MSLYAQNEPMVSVTVAKKKVLIGEQFDLILDARYSDLSAISFFEIDTIPHFEIIQKSKIDTESVENDVLLSQRIILTSFDSGRWQIPALSLANGQGRTQPITIDVVFSEFDPNQEYHDVKEVIEVEKPLQSNWYWYLIGAAILIILFLLLFPRRKKEKTEHEPDVDAYKKAMEDLKKIKKEAMDEKDVKAFYVSLVDIFRRYLHQRKGIQSYYQTTDDLAIQIKSLQLPATAYQNLVQTLRLSDAVKFAKYIPSEAEHKESLETIRNSIDLIEKA